MDKAFDLLQSYLQDAIAAEKNFENRLYESASDCDDDDVKLSFVSHAGHARAHQEQLTERLQALGADPSTGKTLLARFFGTMPAVAQLGHIQEERTVQNLIMAYTIAAASAAMYEGLHNVATAAGDAAVSTLAREMQMHSSRFGEKVFHFIGTRSIIAYNMLTLAEVDPAVETKVGEASWTG